MVRRVVRWGLWGLVAGAVLVLVGISLFAAVTQVQNDAGDWPDSERFAAGPGFVMPPVEYPLMADAAAPPEDRVAGTVTSEACGNRVEPMDGAGAYAFRVVKSSGDWCLDVTLLQVYDYSWLRSGQALERWRAMSLNLGLQPAFVTEQGGLVQVSTAYDVLITMHVQGCYIGCETIPLPDDGVIPVAKEDVRPVTWRALDREVPAETNALRVVWRIQALASSSPDDAAIPAVFEDDEQVTVLVRNPQIMIVPTYQSNLEVQKPQQSVDGSWVVHRGEVDVNVPWNGMSKDAGVMLGVEHASNRKIELIDGSPPSAGPTDAFANHGFVWYSIYEPGDETPSGPVTVAFTVETRLFAPVTERVVVGPLSVLFMTVPLAGWFVAHRQLQVARAREVPELKHRLRRLGRLLVGMLLTYVASILAFFILSVQFGDALDLATFPPSLPATFMILFWFLLGAMFATLALAVALLVRRTTDLDLTREQGVSADLRSKTRELEDFAYAVSHDLKTPVVAMKWLLAELPEPRAKQARADFDATVAQMHDNLEGMEAFIAALLEIAKVGDMALTDDANDLNAVADGVAKQVSHLVAERDATLEIAPHLGKWRGDKTLYKQLLANLVGNALKYGCPEPGGTVRVFAERQDAEAWLVVEDDGPGIPSDERERIFEMFGRGSSASSKPGTGLGLSLVAKIAHAYGGSVRVEDAPHGGARFVVALPASRTRSWRRVWSPVPGSPSPGPV